MKAAWDWHIPVDTKARQREIVEFASSLGFDTLIIKDPSEAMARRGEELGVRIVQIVHASVDANFVKVHPECVQQLLSLEQSIDAAVAQDAPPKFQWLSHRWFSIVQGGEWLCCEHDASMEVLKTRITEALELTGGVALDGFGFRNHYACFCQRCDEIRDARAKENPDLHEVEVLAKMSEESLVRASEVLHDHAKSIQPDALVTNHVWPPFYPNEYFGNRLKLDYCTQTISWFYRPHWSLERVAFEASEMKRLEDRSRNTFVPFIGFNSDSYLVRSPDRVKAELEIAREYGGGHVVLCNLQTPKEYHEIEKVVREELVKM